MEKILVTLLLIVISVSLLIGLISWTNSHKNNITNQAQSIIKNVITNSNS